VVWPSCDFVVVSPLCDFGFELLPFEVAPLPVAGCLFFHRMSFERVPLYFAGCFFFC
jgi:hypothetical protein